MKKTNRGRKPLPKSERKVRLVVYVKPAVIALLDSDPNRGAVVEAALRAHYGAAQ